MRIAEAKDAGCDAVICLSHNRSLFDRYYLSAVPGIDVIIGGHSHDLVPAQIVNGKILVQAGEAGLHLGELELTIDPSKTKKVALVKHTLHEIDSSIRKDPVVLHTLNALRSKIVQDPRFGPMLTNSLGKAGFMHSKTWEPSSKFRDTALGNLVADAVMVSVKKQNLEVDLELVQLYGLQILGGLEYSVAQVEYTRDICLEVSGLEFAYDSSKPATTRVDYSSVKVDGKNPNPYGLYWVALNEQLASFLTALGMVTNATKKTEIREYDAVSDYVGNLGHLRYRATGRVRDTR